MRKFGITGRVYWLKITVGILLLLIVYKRINQDESVLSALANVNPVYIFICLFLLIPHVFVAFLKWRYLLRICFPDISNKETFGSLLFGISLGMVTPGNLGELGRGLSFHNRNKITVTGLTVLDKLSNMLVFATLGFAAISFFILSRLEWGRAVEFFAIAGGTIIISILWLAIFKKEWIKFLVQRIADRFPNHTHIQAFLAVFKHIRQKHVFVILFQTLLWVLIIVTQYHVLILGFTDVDLYKSLLSVPAAIFTKMFLPFSFGGLGIREGLTVFYFSLFNVSNAAVFNVSVIIFFINFLLPASVGFYYVLQLNGRMRKADDDFEKFESDLPARLASQRHTGLQTKLEND